MTRTTLGSSSSSSSSLSVASPPYLLHYCPDHSRLVLLHLVHWRLHLHPHHLNLVLVGGPFTMGQKELTTSFPCQQSHSLPKSFGRLPTSFVEPNNFQFNGFYRSMSLQLRKVPTVFLTSISKPLFGHRDLENDQ